MAEALINIEVLHAAPDGQLLLAIEVPAGATVQQVLAMDAVVGAFPKLDLSSAPVGIFGRVVADSALRILVEGDRIELYRPLLADPKEVRRLRAAKAAQARLENK